jgi:acetyl esterase/lipase
VVIVHGGAWIGGDKKERAPLARDVRNLTGLRVYAVNYRLTRGGMWGAFGDVARAVQWAKRQPGVDPSRVVVWGDSAGGQLALMVAARGWAPAVVWSAPTNLLRPGPVRDSVQQWGIGCSPQVCGRTWRALSPIYQLTRRSSPVWMTAYTEDPTGLTADNTRPYVRRARALGVDTRFVVQDGDGHAVFPIDTQTQHSFESVVSQAAEWTMQVVGPPVVSAKAGCHIVQSDGGGRVGPPPARSICRPAATGAAAGR